MSSSRRPSSVSSRSSTLRAPKWQTSSGLSAQPATSISKVFAQPLQGSPLRSAVDQLPAHVVLSQDDHRSTISRDDVSMKRERSASSLASVHESQNTLLADGGSYIASSNTSIALKEEESHVDEDSVPPPRTDLNATPQAEQAPPASQPITIAQSPPAPTRTPSAPNSKSSSYLSTVPSPPSRSSWFGTLSRTRGRQSSVTAASAAPEPQLSASPNSTSSLKLSEEPQDRPDVQLSTSGPDGTQITVGSTLSSSPQELSLDMRPSSPHMTSNPSSAVSSIDDEVPSPKVEVVGTNAPVKPMEVVTRKASISDLNPSISRFILRIPMLGRPKTPLEEVIAHPSKEPAKITDPEPQPVVPQVIVSQPSTDSLAEPCQPTPEQTPSQAPTEDTLSTHEKTVPDDTNTELTPTPEQSAQGSSEIPQSSSSWWSYIAWSPSASTTEVNKQELPAEQPTSLPEQTEVESSSSATHNPPSEALVQESNLSETTSPATDAIANPENESTSEVTVKEGQKTELKTDKPQTPSLFSSETEKSQGSAWYSPWSWYAASPIVPSSSSGFPSSDPKADQQASSGHEQEESRTMTESEMVKEEALARDSETDATPRVPPAQLSTAVDTDASESLPTPKATSPSPSLNPIESSITANKSGWASFFMSKALLVKNITDGQEAKTQNQGEMEVMDIDEDDDRGTQKDGGGEGSTAVTAQSDNEKAIAATSSGSKAIAIAPKKPRSVASATPSASTSPKPQEPAKAPLKEREPKKPGPPAPPLTNSDSIKKETAKVRGSGTRSPSPAPSKASANSPRTTPPNLVLPTWNDTFLSPPRSLVPPPPPTPPAAHKGKLGKTIDFVSGVLWSGKDGKDEQHGKGSVKGKGKGKEREKVQDNPFIQFGMELPKALDVIGQTFDPNSLDEKCRIVVIGVAGWMPGAITRTLAGGLPSSSSKFVDLTCTALENFEEEHGFKFQKITRIPLEGDGTIDRKLEKIHTHLMGNEEWIGDLHSADVIFVAAHSQGSVVAVHLIDKLIKDGHIMTERNADIIAQAVAQVAPAGAAPPSTSTTRTQKICCLALCGIHLGPLRYLKTSSLLQPYIQYFENAAARELFDFQDTESEVSKKYIKALNSVMDHGTKMVYVASLNDQVVPIYSGLFTAASHPRILRALYIDGDAYHSSDFLSNLLVLLIRIMNSGLSDSGLLAHLSEATAGTLSGVGHSSAYEELASYSLAVNYLFLTTDGTDTQQELVVESFNAVNEQNDYEIPWSLRDLIADERVAHFFASEFSQLKDAFDQWSPKTTILRDVKRKLQPIQRLSSIKGSSFGSRL